VDGYSAPCKMRCSTFADGPALPAPAARMLAAGVAECPWPLPNVWLGTSIECDEYSWRADELRATPAAVRFLSLEPLLSSLPRLDLTVIDWVIVGGESGPKARPMDPGWARSLRDRCVADGVAFHFKLLCTSDRCSATVVGCAISESDTVAVSHLPAMTGA
jgi:protein gp37